MTEPLLEARGLEVRRGRRTVLHGVDIALRAGEAAALLGPNAAGKSTLLRACLGLLPVARGEVRLLGRPLGSWPREEVARVVALVTPEDEGLAALTVGERVALGRYPHRGPFRPYTAADRAAVQRALLETGTERLAPRTLATLSAGERQLAALARGLAQEPRVLLLDEPGAHLDVGHQLRVFRLLDRIRGSGVAVLAVVHDLQRAAAWADRAVLLVEGRVADVGPPDEVLRGEACERAFGVSVRGFAVGGLPHPLYSFEPPADQGREG